ncbi:MAG: hypothetical protein ABSF91_07870 [Bacteroidota bacterium]
MDKLPAIAQRYAFYGIMRKDRGAEIYLALAGTVGRNVEKLGEDN